MSAGRSVRAASPADVPFLVRAVLEAERLGAGTARTMYEAVYELSHDETTEFLTSQLEADVPGHPLSFASFRIVDLAGDPAAACAGWVEETGTRASGLRVAMAMSRHLGTARFNRRREAIAAVSAAAPRRTPGAVQLESFYTVPAARGARLASMLIADHLAMRHAAGCAAEIVLLSGNTAALAAYRRAGFVEAWRTPAGADGFRQLTGHDGFVQLHRAALSPVPTAP
jgi:ribosomal protein S18 acetylase RimI-like enzyme